MAGIEMKGRKFGRLTVIERHHSTPKKVFWTCKCDCGKTAVVDGWHLRSGKTQSCGCYRLDRVRDVTFKDMTGQTVNGIKVISFDHTDNRRQVYWKCICPYCGKPFVTRGSSIRNGHAKSCGCDQGTHKMCYSKLYHIHQGMLKRCNDPKHDAYPNYGGRGIYVCDEWSNKGMTPQEVLKAGNPGFMNFYKWAMKNGYKEPDPKQPKGKRLSIDRIDVNGPYAPWNCRFVTMDDQQLNKRNTCYINDGEEMLVWSQFCRKYNLDPGFVTNRYYTGWSLNGIVYAAKHPELGIHIPRGPQKHKFVNNGRGIYLDKDEFRRLIPIIPNQWDGYNNRQ